jgi:diguanylate cyclase (GGDEF)-like protein
MEETLNKELDRAEREAYPVSLIMMDIDCFKCLNDTFGHKAGDQVLQALGKLMHAQIRRGDVACRSGGEEFLIIMPKASLSAAHQRAETIRAAFAALRIDYGDQVLQATLSLGVATYPEHGMTADQLVQATDSALYAAKKAGRNRVILA